MERKLLNTLNQIVRGTDEFRSAETAGKLIKIPTGDGMGVRPPHAKFPRESSL